VTRPDDLPDFRAPPLHEVVIGVQFAPARGYSQIHAAEVWALFRAQYPLVEEHPPLQPVFEMFGNPQPPQLQFNLGFLPGARHDRFWFVTPEKEELIQFQQDRLLHNWRKISGSNNEYPRFERMIEKFERELGGLEDYFSTLSPQTLAINQCEIVYVNHIPCEGPASCVGDDWLRFLKFGRDPVPEDFTAGFRRVLSAPDGRLVGRLICEATTALEAGKPIIRLTLTVRGAPDRSDMHSALAFLQSGREIVVKAFAEITTESAHKTWQRFQ
jgi:uncharacterized protein (TIGR04255 family)